MESFKPPGAPLPAPRRVFTAPSYPSAPQLAASSQPAAGVVETLYDHPSVKIVSLMAGPRQVSFSSRNGLSQPTDVEPGSLSWSSHLERTIAVGPFRIYRAPGSVAFLNCGSALQPILPKSQVWCVDEDSSKFILQIRRPQYWRIEIPVANPNDIQRAQHLRQVFDTILQFEKTPCPFKRSFTVQLPEPPRTPVKKRPWTPAQGLCHFLPPTPVTPVEVARIRMDIPKMEPLLATENAESSSNPAKVSDEGADKSESPDVNQPSEERNDNDGNVENRHGIIKPTVDDSKDPVAHPNPLKLGTAFPALRTVTAPPQLTLNASPPSKVREEGRTESVHIAPRSPSPTDSQGSFHSVKSWDDSSLPPSPPLSNPASPQGLSCPTEVTGETLEEVNTEEIAPTSSHSPTWTVSPVTDFSSSLTAPSSTYDASKASSTCDEVPAGEHPQTPAPASEQTPTDTSTSASSSLMSQSSLEVTQRPPIRRRGTTSSSISPSRRALSPLPSAANLFAPRRNSHGSMSTVASKLDVVRRIPMAIIQTTCEILMSPPSHLISLMLRVAARITAGEWRGFVFGTDEHGERIPVHWDMSDDEDGDAPACWKGGQRKYSLGWLPITGQKMAGTFPESDDEDSDHTDTPLRRSISNEAFPVTFTKPKYGKIQEETAEESLAADNVGPKDWNGGSEVD